jgi:hypothetical protein
MGVLFNLCYAFSGAGREGSLGIAAPQKGIDFGSSLSQSRAALLLALLPSVQTVLKK